MSEGDHLKVIKNPGRVAPGEAPGATDSGARESSPPVEHREPDVLGRTVYLPRRLFDKLDQLAEFLEVDSSELVTAAVRNYVQQSVRSLGGKLNAEPSSTTESATNSSQQPAASPASQESTTERSPRPPQEPRTPRTSAHSEPTASPGSADPSRSLESGRVRGGGADRTADGADPEGPEVDPVDRGLLESCVARLEELDGRSLDDPDAVRVLAEIADRAAGRDYSPESHPHEVARLARLLADEMIGSEADRRVVEIGGLLHDVGKILVPSELLRKRGSLTPREQRELKAYPEFGAEILESCPALAPIVPVVRHHKERWDGQGYPASLDGDSIPPGARIVGLAEAYNSMMSPRPYRPPLTPDAAREAIGRRSGEIWCPETVAALEKVIERDGPHPWAPSTEADGAEGS